MKKFRYLILLLVMLVTTKGVAQQKSIDLNWQTDFEKVKQSATSEHKLVLIYFTGSDWSTPCKLLDKDFFYTSKFQKIASENFILLRVNSPRRPDLISNLQEDKNLKLRKTYQQKIFPSVVLINPQGKLIGRIEGYNYLHDTSKHYKLLKEALSQK